MRIDCLGVLEEEHEICEENQMMKNVMEVHYRSQCCLKLQL